MKKIEKAVSVRKEKKARKGTPAKNVGDYKVPRGTARRLRRSDMRHFELKNGSAHQISFDVVLDAVAQKKDTRTFVFAKDSSDAMKRPPGKYFLSLSPLFTQASSSGYLPLENTAS